MGNCGGTPEHKEENQRNKEIENQIKKDKKAFEREIKLLLLGAGESGKSTIAKQMRIIYLEGFGAEERIHYKDVIYSNLVTAMKALVLGARKLNLEMDLENQGYAELFSENAIITAEMTPELQQALKSLWKDKGIQEALKNSNQFQLYDSTEYYFNDFDRLMSADYIPNEQDILRSRAKTTGITETEFDVDNVHFRMVDVGGQRSERKKWIHCFQDVTAVVFCVAMSEYDLKLYEDESVNRMHESLKLFDEICNSKWFAETSIILFLNKSDIFREKIKTSDLSVCFPAFKGGSSYEKASSYMQKQFVKLNKNTRRKEVYCHCTTATDTKNITFVFNVVKDILIKKVLLGGGVM